MADRSRPISGSAPHDEHDVELVVELATARPGSAAGPDLAAADALIASCNACATLASDVRSMAGALVALDVPERPRDFRLTEPDAARLRPSTSRRILGLLRRPRLNVGQPVAAGLTALGLAGLLVTTLPVGGPAGGASNSAPARAPALDSVAQPQNQPLQASPAASGGTTEIGPGAGAGAPAATPARPPVTVAPGAASAGGEPTQAAAGGAASPAAEGAGESPVSRDTAGEGEGGRVQALPGTTPVPAVGGGLPEVAPGPDVVRVTLALASAGLVVVGLALLVTGRRRHSHP